MEILTATLTKDDISLVSDSTFTRLVLSYGKNLKTTYELTGLSTTTQTITKEALGLETLDNSYFKLEILDDIENKAGVGLYNLEVINNAEATLYDAKNLKQDLDNLNFYDGILFNLNESKHFREANEVFESYKHFLETKLNGNNFLQTIGRQE